MYYNENLRKLNGDESLRITRLYTMPRAILDVISGRVHLYLTVHLYEIIDSRGRGEAPSWPLLSLAAKPDPFLNAHRRRPFFRSEKKAVWAARLASTIYDETEWTCRK